MSGYPGESSSYAYLALKDMLEKYGQPNTLVWAHGMNDGSDTGDAPNSTWLNALNNVVKMCNKYNINIVLSTIPTVPSVYNEKKNTYIRESGFKYIDFAKAVGADGTGAWYTGMLSSDNVHPTESGALALYMQAIIDCPDITFDGV